MGHTAGHHGIMMSKYYVKSIKNLRHELKLFVSHRKACRHSVSLAQHSLNRNVSRKLNIDDSWLGLSSTTFWIAHFCWVHGRSLFVNNYDNINKLSGNIWRCCNVYCVLVIVNWNHFPISCRISETKVRYWIYGFTLGLRMGGYSIIIYGYYKLALVKYSHFMTVTRVNHGSPWFTSWHVVNPMMTSVFFFRILHGKSPIWSYRDPHLCWRCLGHWKWSSPRGVVADSAGRGSVDGIKWV